MIYLDYATTPVDPRVVDKMVDILKYQYANSSSVINTSAKDINDLIEDSRNNIANLIGAPKNNIIFTSGATESNNLVLKGLYEINGESKNHIITTRIEHKSILETCKYLEKRGAEITYLEVNSEGNINLDELKSAICNKTLLVTIMAVNNEIGLINDIETIGEICHKSNVLFHSDMTQGLGKIKIDVGDLNLDFASFSAHKIYGPKGIGCVYIGNDKKGKRHKIEPLLHGGKQEFSIRAGTSANHDIVGFGLASKIAKDEFIRNNKNIREVEKHLLKKLNESNLQYKIIGDQQNKVPGIINLLFYKLNNSMFFTLYKDELCLSFGSACSLSEPSYVIKSVSNDIDAKNIIRISIGRKTTYEEVESMIRSLENYFEDYV